MKLFAALLVVAASGLAVGQGKQDQKVILVLLDGIRWQEVFRGVDPDLMNKEAGGVEKLDDLKKAFWRESAEERRRTLMPFVWNTVAKQGQLIGNRDEGSNMRVANKYHFSYPGYSEMIVGIADDRIDTNNPIRNPNPSVFEFLNSKPGFKGKVAVFSVWNVVPAMVNRDTTKLPVNAAMEPMTFGKRTPAIDAINGLKRNAFHLHPNDPTDAFAFYTAMEYLRNDKPRALWITFGETDTFAHEGRYDRYVDAIRRTDRMLEELWNGLQSMPEYRGKTTLIFSVDHGRGLAPRGWRDHGSTVPGAAETWLGIIGPNTPALGVHRNTPEVTTSQIAATVGLAVGMDFAATNVKIAKAIADVIKR